MLKEATLLTKVIVGAFSAVVVTAATIGVIKLVQKDAYRQIGVYEVDGTAIIERNKIGTMDAYVNMQLQSEDKANTKEESYLQLKLDEDKFILLDPLTSIELVATGTSEDSKTRIELREGAIINKIMNPLSADSTYEVNTPNSTMSVRGTIFRVEVWKDENGLYHTLLSVIEGIVVSNLHDADGNLTNDLREFKAGEVAHMVEGSDESYYVGGTEELVLDDYLRKELEFIGIVFDDEEEEIIEEEEENGEDILEPEEEEIEEEEDDEDADAGDGGAGDASDDSTDDSGDDPTDDSGDDSTDDSSGDSSSDDDTSGSSSNSSSYTVTYDFGNGITGTKDYNVGDVVTAPSIKPSGSGAWTVVGGTNDGKKIESEQVTVTEAMTIKYQ